MRASEGLVSGHLVRLTCCELLGDDAGAWGLHLKDLNGVVHALGGMVEDEAGIGNVGIEQLVLSTTEIDIAVIDRTVLVDVVVQ